MSVAVPASSPLISILIVNFNSSALLRRCLDALARSTIAERLQIIVVDNASADFDVDAFREGYRGTTLLPQTTNLTYTGGNNVAFEQATGDLVLLLNPDTEVDPGALENALGHFQTDPSLVGLGAYLVGPDGQLQRYYRRLPTVRDLPSLLFERFFGRTRRGRRYLMLDESFSKPTLVEQPPGAFLMFRRTAVRSDALLDSAYFNFFSDADLCRRLLKEGQIVVFPDVRCFHLRAGAGVGTKDPVARLRLYHDFIWGLHRYFGARPATAELYLAILAYAYLLTRAVTQVIRSPGAIKPAFNTWISWLWHKPPTYR